MPKIKVKSNRSAAKRFRVTGTGKIKRWSGGKSHSNVKKGRKRVNRLASGKYHEGTEAIRIKRVLPYL
ncbi:MAG: 50S ribosomal protein L35 [Deltaproteobacteria bacterium]